MGADGAGPMERWSSGRVTLLGDACHPTLPFLGQGGVMAIEDAYVVAACMAKHFREPEIAFARYEEIRRERTAAVVRRSHENRRWRSARRSPTRARSRSRWRASGSRSACANAWNGSMPTTRRRWKFELERVPARLNRRIPSGLWMSEFIGIGSLLGGGTMPKAYSSDMRGRVIARVESGGSRREAAEHYDVSASAAVIWVKCFHETGRCAAKPRGGSISPLEKHAAFLLALIDAQPDLTLDEVVSVMRQATDIGQSYSRLALLPSAQDHLQKKPARGGAGARGRGAGPTALDARTGHVGPVPAGVHR